MLTIRSREEAEKSARDEKIDELINPIDTDPTQFNTAFKEKFKPVVDDIADFLQLDEEKRKGFKGSLDDIMMLESFILKQDPSTEQGREAILRASVLETRWNSADKLCRYLGGRLGWRQPRWFIEGWKLFQEDEEVKDDNNEGAM